MSATVGRLRQSPYAPFATIPIFKSMKGMTYMTKMCAMCGKIFEGRQQKYCSFQCSWKAKQEKSQRKTKSQRKATLCWDCKNACGGCSWSRSFVPVKGWDAKETSLKSAEGDIKSYFVTMCPEFING